MTSQSDVRRVLKGPVFVTTHVTVLPLFHKTFRRLMSDISS